MKRLVLLFTLCLVTFLGSAVGFGTLATNRQSLTMTKTTVTGDIKQTLNTHLYF